MNREILITIIACVIIFSGIGILVSQTMNTDQVSKPQSEKISEMVKTPDPVKTSEVDKTQKTTDIYSIESLEKSPKNLITKIDDKTALLKTLTALRISEDNKLPWATIKGKVVNPAAGYPVIIKFFKSFDEIPVHVAQVNMNDDDTFEYMFRVFSIDDGITTNIFEGEYYVEVFKTVNIQ